MAFAFGPGSGVLMSGAFMNHALPIVDWGLRMIVD